MGKKNVPTIHKAHSKSEFQKLNNELNKRGLVALDVLRPGLVRELTLGDKDPSINKASDLATCIGAGAWSNGPLAKVAWSFDARDESVVPVTGKDGKPLGRGYVKWGPGNCTPSAIPVLAQALPYTAAPLRYIADLTAGLGPKLMYRFPDGKLVEFKDAGEILLTRIEELKGSRTKDAEYEEEDPTELVLNQVESKKESSESDALRRARKDYEEWERTWYGYDEKDEDGIANHIPGAKDFLEENNLNLHLTQCEQDDVMLDIYFPTVYFHTWGRRGYWAPKITKVDMLPCHSTRLEMMNENRYIDHVYFSDEWRTQGSTNTSMLGSAPDNTVMYQAAMPQHLLHELRYIVESHQRTRIKERPRWIVCPTLYPSGQKPYYPQPAWWSIFTSKAYDFSSTILYDKAKQRENRTSWGKIFYISLDYLDRVIADHGLAGKTDEIQKLIDEIEHSMEDFLQHRENHGKMMRQWMWQGQDGKDHHNVEIVDVAETTKDEASAGKEELELSTSPIFLALQVDPRLVGVPMVHSSNGGTALREMHLLKQQQLNVKQRLYLHFLNTIIRFNEWSERAEFHIAQQTLTTLDNSKTGTVETISGEKA